MFNTTTPLTSTIPCMARGNIGLPVRSNGIAGTLTFLTKLSLIHTATVISYYDITHLPNTMYGEIP